MMDNAVARRGVLALWDVLCWTAGAAFVIGIRYSFRISEVQWEAVLRFLVLSWLMLVLAGVATKFYRGRFLVGSFEEALGLALHFFGVAAVMVVTAPVLNATLPRSLPVLAPPIALVGAAAGRWFYRALRSRTASAAGTSHTPALIYGAGDAGRQVLRLLRSDRTRSLSPVGFIDDNVGKRHLRIHGVPVVGVGSALEEVVRATGAEALIVAIPGASGDLVDRVQRDAAKLGLEVYVLPRLGDLSGGQVEAHDIRPVEISDVLGRHQIRTDVSSIADYVAGKRVLVTGAGGSIGSELARQLHKFGPSALTMLDRDESALHAVQLSIFGHGMLDTPETVLVDIRDTDGLRAVFAEARPDIVFHAAALKHLPMLERFPAEGWKTNVLGTLNLLALSREFDVKRFVNISTDKAADPSSVLGSTKRLAEQLTAWYAEETGRPYISVRFGNVLGSRGSMLHTFNAQIAEGGPVTVTHPDVTRYFMTIPEACELVIQAGALGRGGEAMVLNMGEPVHILDVAKRMIELSGASGVEIVFSGLRQGEKLHETLFGEDEQSELTEHAMIRRVSVSSVAPESLASPAFIDEH